MRIRNMGMMVASATIVMAGSAMAGLYQGAGQDLVDENNPLWSTIVVTDDFEVTDINVTLHDLNHTWAGDLHIYLQAPNGDTQDLVNRPGVPVSTFGDSSNYGGDYTFDDAAAGDLPAVAASLPGSDDIIPGGGYFATSENDDLVLINDLAGNSSAGEWTLHIEDGAAGDDGSLGSWTLELVGVPAPGALALLGLAGLCGRRRRA